jgi:hypothetical protein
MKQLVSMAMALIVVVLAAGPVSAGGWAVTTLDSIPAAAANQKVEVGFTIRQHGVTPVNPDGDVGIVFRSSSGQERFFAAEAVGPVGHYVAEVTFPDPGAWTWAVRQGWFADQALGTLELASRRAVAPSGDYRWPGWIRVGLPTLAVLFGAAAMFEFTSQRRRRVVAI